MKILSEGKFRNFDGFIDQGTKKVIEVNLENDISLTCTTDHKFLTQFGWKQAIDLNVNDYLDGNKFLNILDKNENEKVYDALNVCETNSFYTNGVTSHNCSFLYIDETAFLTNWDEFFASVYPTIASGETTKMLLTSTPNGLNHFWKICKEAQEDKNKNGIGKNGYKYFEVSWPRVPGRDEKWKEETLASLGWNYEQFNQEFCGSFIGSVDTLISGQALTNLSFIAPIAKAENISQYVIPIEKHIYSMVVDVSRGKGLDYSTFSIFDITKMPYTQVCTFRDNFISPADYASILYRMAKLYNDAYVLIEINDIGGQVADALFMEFGYENMLFTESGGRSGKRISAGFSANIDRGIRTTKSVKSIGCSILKLLIEQTQLIINDADTIYELGRFSKKAGSYEAESGSHDDMVMTLVLFAWLCDQNYFKELSDINTIMKLREKTEQELDDGLLPFGFIVDGHENLKDLVHELGSSIVYE